MSLFPDPDERPTRECPTFQCKECGSTGPFTTIDYGDGDFDLECACGSVNIAEDPKEAFNHVLCRAEDAEANEANLRKLVLAYRHKMLSIHAVEQLSGRVTDPKHYEPETSALDQFLGLGDGTPL